MRVASIFGVTIRINPFLLPLLTYALFSGWAVQVISALICIIVHELSHIAVARAYRIRVAEIEILPFGSVARLSQRMELVAGAEGPIAVAGPVSSIFLAMLAHVLSYLGLTSGEGADWFISVNLYIAAFNSLPLLPMDGGRIARSLLAKTIGLIRATKLVAKLSFAIAFIAAVTFGIASVQQPQYSAVPLVFTFVCLGALSELRGAAFSFYTGLISRRDELAEMNILPVVYLRVHNDMTVKEAVTALVQAKYSIFLVVNASGIISAQVEELQVLDAFLKGDAYTTLSALAECRRS